MSGHPRPSESQCLVCPQCASRSVQPVFPTTDTLDMRCGECDLVWALPLPPQVHRLARFTIARFNVWRSAVERRRRQR